MNQCKLLLVFLLILTSSIVKSQISYQAKNKAKVWIDKKLSESSSNKKKGDPKFNPFYNGRLLEHFSQDQIDFSNKFQDWISNEHSKEVNRINAYSKYDFSFVWKDDYNSDNNGVLGRNYQRIQFHIDSVFKSNISLNTYKVFGKSKVNNNICSFNGEIKIMSVYDLKNEQQSINNELVANYTFYEDSTQNNSGVFKGVTNCYVYLDKKTKIMRLDDSNSDGDGYQNRNFVGTWTGYNSKQSKNCIWGDYRLPFTFDFDCGDGEMIVSNKYVKYGWQSFNDFSEYIDAGNGKFELKNKWWITVKK